MKSKILTAMLVAVILITLAGCGHTQAVRYSGANTADVSLASVTSDTKSSDDALRKTDAAIHSEIITEKETRAVQSESDVASMKSAKLPSSVIKQKTPKKQSEPSENPGVPTSSLEKSVQTTARPETALQVPKPTEKPTTKPCEPQFDIDYWIEYAKNYAEGIGLRLERSAVDCWDNPIGANAKCRYLERDIKNRLNHYAKAEDITDVWIWAEKSADNSYEIYIGYA